MLVTSGLRRSTHVSVCAAPPGAILVRLVPVPRRAQSGVGPDARGLLALRLSGALLVDEATVDVPAAFASEGTVAGGAHGFGVVLLFRHRLVRCERSSRSRQRP